MPTDMVLVVDDDPVILATIAEILTGEGYATLTAQNGVEALQQFERNHPRLVLLDMRMPVFDGFGFARMVQESRPDLKIIAMTASEDASRWAEQINADGYLPKPFDIEQLLDEVRRVYR
jgi:two-component system, chemotaxis family, chemotaxis protein CheY